MDKLCFAFVTAITALISLDTLRRLYVDRHRFLKEDLNDYDLAFVWRIVIFLIYPLLNLLALAVSVIVCQNFGGYVKSLSYGLLWYQMVPDELSSRIYLMPTLFSGELAQTLFVLLLLFALLFRPHPFLAIVLTYSCTFVLSINLIVDPLLSILGFGSSHWQMAINQGTRHELTSLVIIHSVLAALFIILAHNETVQKLFAELIRPVAMKKLKEALIDGKDKADALTLCNLIMLYEGAGLPQQASARLNALRRKYPQALLTSFSEAYLCYRRRNFQRAFRLFQFLADSNADMGNELRGMLLAAAACCAHADRDYATALNLVDRALEFDHHCSMARMIKIDVFLKQGKEENAAQELHTAISAGLDQDIEQNVPIEWQRVIKLIAHVDTCNEEASNGTKPANQGPSTI